MKLTNKQKRAKKANDRRKPVRTVPLSGRHIAAHQRGEYELWTRSNWRSGTMLICFRVDQRQGQTDGLSLLQYLKTTFLPTMRIITSDDSHNGYVNLKVTQTLRWVNHQRELLHARCTPLTAEMGYHCTVEVYGSFRAENESRARWKWKEGVYTYCPLPRFTSVEQVTEFAAEVAKVDDPGYIKLMNEGKAALERMVEKYYSYELASA